MKYILLLTLFTLVACGDSPSGPSSLEGAWKSDDPEMVAHISNNSIKIEFTDGTTSALYWLGSLPSTTAIEGDKLLSKGDTEAMDRSFTGSQNATKEFKVEDGKLKFSLSMLGTTTQVTLKR